MGILTEKRLDAFGNAPHIQLESDRFGSTLITTKEEIWYSGSTSERPTNKDNKWLFLDFGQVKIQTFFTPRGETFTRRTITPSGFEIAVCGKHREEIEKLLQNTINFGNVKLYEDGIPIHMQLAGGILNILNLTFLRPRLIDLGYHI